MVLDGFDDLNVLHGAFAPASYRLPSRGTILPPQSQQSSIVITTRNKELAYSLASGHGSVIEVGPMPVVDATNLLRKGLGSRFQSGSDMNAVVGLVKALGLLPLAISQACVHISFLAPKVSLKEYLDRLQEDNEEMIDLLETPVRYDNGNAPNTILKIWQTLFNSILSKRPSAIDLLSFMSFLDKRGIPRWLLRRYKENDATPRANSPTVMGHLELDGGDPDKNNDDAWNTIDDDIKMLASYYLINSNGRGDMLEMHGLVQVAVKMSLHDTRIRAFEQQVIQRVAAEFPTAYKNWTLCQQLFAHVQAAAKYKPNRDTQETWTTLLYNGGRYARLQGNYKVAMQMATKSRLARQNLTEDDADTLQGESSTYLPADMSLFALILMDQGLYSRANESLTQAVERCEAIGLGTNHPSTLTIKNNLASVYRVQGRWTEAENLQTSVVEARRSRLGADHYRTLTSMANLASIYSAQGRYREAEGLQLQVMEGFKSTHGPEHPHTLISMSNLASIYRIQGKLQDAESLQTQAMWSRREKFGTNHPDTLASMNSLASIFRAQGQPERAEELQREVVEIRTRSLGSNHPNTLASKNNLALTYNDQGKGREAWELQSQVVELTRAKLGPQHPHTLTGLNNLALIAKCQGRHTEAMTLMRSCAKTRQQVLGRSHPYTQSSTAVMNRWKEEMGLP